MRCAAKPVKSGDRYILETQNGAQVVDRRAMRAGLNLFGLPLKSFATAQQAVAWAKRNQ